jgi:hypothetical protein
MLAELHGGRSGGHLGVTKTLDKVSGTTSYTREATLRGGANSVTPDQLAKDPNQEARPDVPENVGAPFERNTIGIAGSFPESERGKRHLLIAMDYFIKWPEVYTIPNTRHQRQRNFESPLLLEVLQRLRINKARTTPLHQQLHGTVKRYVKTVEEQLRKVASKRLGSEATHLPAGLQTINPRDHMHHSRQHGVREGATSFPRSVVRCFPDK